MRTNRNVDLHSNDLRFDSVLCIGFLVRAPGLPLIQRVNPYLKCVPQPWSGDLGQAMHLIRNPQSSQRWSETLSYFCSLLKLSDLCLSQMWNELIINLFKATNISFSVFTICANCLLEFSDVHKWQKPVFFFLIKKFILFFRSTKGYILVLYNSE